MCKQLSHIYHFSISCTSKVGCCILRRFYYSCATFQKIICKQ
uniref:Uncharacterized protein n=1 Tax=Myoviridae sp. ctVeR24 TaxID=2827689 RepID=A0A8S5SX79_9CAUD|nr:MAG TPA: hypothetical protein [Myoviridae sp. ctVeR24]